ncbi:MAG TPA: transcriptional repressor [Haploplasma sp.]|nr:transcriptional repressor [Haploplasma sp.]
MDLKLRYYDQIRKSGHRLTDNRIAMIEILENNHFTFKQIQVEMKKKGFNNVATIYNNLEFLVREKIIAELHIANTIYYDLAMDNPGHSNDSHIHINVIDKEEITEINDIDIFEYITCHEKLKHLNIDSIQIVIDAKSKDAN